MIRVMNRPMIRKNAVLAMFAALALLLAGLTSAPAHAQNAEAISQAKAAGIVGEMYSGYLGFVDASGATSSLRRRVDETNAKRLELYTATSQRTGESVEVIAAVTAEKLINGADVGEWVKPGANSAWMKK